MSAAFKSALTSVDGRRALLETKVYALTLPETLRDGALHLLTWMELRATADERKKWDVEQKEAKGRVKSGRGHTDSN